MPLNHYVTLGRSGLRVSPLCLGAMTFGQDWGWGADPATSHAMLDHYVDAGGNFIDTANNYTDGHSEEIIGDYLAAGAVRRDSLVIASKFFSNMFPGDPNGGGASRKAMMQQCEGSLRRLRTDYLDLYWIHSWDHLTPIEETMRGLDDLVQSGKVRYIGFSDTPAWKVAQAQMVAHFRGWSPFVALQLEYSLLQRTIEGELLPMAAEFGLGVTPWGALAGGALSGKLRRDQPSQSARPSFRRAFTDADWALFDVLRDIGAELSVSSATVALAWAAGRPGVTSPIVGARSLDQLKDNLAALDLSLPAEARDRLDRMTKPSLPFPCDFLTHAPEMMHRGAVVNRPTFFS